ncbi:MAG: hypothetical protein BGO47_07745 [Microbacterium sp. 67-17]|uniref:polysaccharide pyruvyl transferase family protein n=1 Tax=Microbacterium sp. 67-17 TaxID=1895782 RepID=UPI0009593A89|nr:polysaccharide pyruvyl transferase family protein [Microbacterium sp. 67-17]OJV98178.1 MAG: hypothetical protein BGO47_07745 [Microbacterium sp. 67-17]
MRLQISKLYFLTRAMLALVAARNREKILLIGSPYHSNLGDQAQTLVTEEWLADLFPGVPVITIDTRTAALRNNSILRLARRWGRSGDRVFLHSGYHMTDLYPDELRVQIACLRIFDKNPVVVLPQTINFAGTFDMSELASSIIAHPKLLIVARDERSEEIGRGLFPGVKISLAPDVVTRAIGSFTSEEARIGINLCLRNDKESMYGEGEKARDLEEQLARIATVSRTDTESPLSAERLRHNLAYAIHDAWHNFATFRVTVTDRYHGTIFSVIAGIPVVVLSSTDHKLASGVRWFENGPYSERVRFASTAEEAAELVKEFYAASLPRIEGRYFVTEYFAALEKLILEHCNA